MVFVTGDLHGGISIAKLFDDKWPQQKELTKDDYLIVCGDFGMLWDGSTREMLLLDWLESRKYTTLFCFGNHENFEMYKEIPVDEWCGGKVQRVREHVMHLMTGEIFDIQGKSFFVFGGASSHDKEYRKPGISWWPEEIPSTAEFERAGRNLQKRNNQVDYVITHCASNSTQDEINPEFKRDKVTEFLDWVEYNVQFEKWFMGHYHLDEDIDERHRVVFDKIVKLG